MSSIAAELCSAGPIRRASLAPGKLDRVRLSPHECCWCTKPLCGLMGRYRDWRVLRTRPGVAHAVDHGDGAQHGDHPKYRSHAVEQSAEDHEDEAFGALHESDAAGTDQAFSAGAGIADHDGADHHEGCEDDIEESSAAGIKN